MNPKHYLAFDIETVPLGWGSFSESQQEYLLRGAENEEEKEKRKGLLGLSPLTAKVVCIGMQLMGRESGGGEYSMEKRAAFSVDESLTDDESKEVELSTGDICFLYTEEKVLENFWKVLEKYDPDLISFNGRNFDAPFLMLRSALLKVRPSRNLMAGTKFNYPKHIDLIDELTFFNPGWGFSATKRFNFDFYARAFGITSPKAQDIDGSKVPEYYADGKILEISEYCLRDVVATWELFKVWREYLKF